jgi:hypothetical protein
MLAFAACLASNVQEAESGTECEKREAYAQWQAKPGDAVASSDTRGLEILVLMWLLL